MEIKKMQKRINAMDYWDREVLDFSINYFGDEVRIIIDCVGCPKNKNNEKRAGCTLKCLFCYKVEYITDAKDGEWRKNIEVKDMNRCQLGHYMQEIEVKESRIDGFIEVNINTSLLFAKIICRDLVIESVECINDNFLE